MKVFAFSGSLRTGSFNTKLIDVAVPLLREKGVEVDLWDFRAAQVPLYDPDTSETNYPAALANAKARLKAAHGVLLSTPEYNHGLPGYLKNLVDFLTRPPKTSPFRGLVFAQLGATPGGFGTLHAQHQLRQLIDAVGGFNGPGHFVVSRAESAFTEEGALADEKKHAELSSYLDRFVDLLGKLKGTGG